MIYLNIDIYYPRTDTYYLAINHRLCYNNQEIACRMERLEWESVIINSGK